MLIDESIFKSYDIRGIYDSQLTDEAAYRIGRAFAQYLSATAIAVGQDMRTSTPAIAEAFMRGIREHGTNVIDLGMTTTPMVYYASATLPVDGAAMITASHNPGEYNGMKFCRKQALPIGKASGLMDIKALALGELPEAAAKPGEVTTDDIAPAFHEATKHFATFGDTPFSLVIDTANAMGALDLPLWRSFPNLTITALFEELDGSFPNHEANPLNEKTLTTLAQTVREKGAHLGFAYDGDGDRIGFVDEAGVPVPGDLVLALLARELLKEHPGRAVLYDVRCSRAVPEIITEAGGVPIESPVGHSNIKALMRENDALLAGEISMHYYFHEFSFADNSTLAALLLLDQMHESGRSLSELIASVRRYHHSGELNFTIGDTAAVLTTLKDTYADGELSELDGLKISYPDWWFSVRTSNTEPVVRLNLEANSAALLAEKRRELTTMLTSAQ